MGETDMERTTAFEHHMARAQATQVVELPWGYAVLQADFPFSQYHNRIVVTDSTPAADILATADEVLGGAGVAHRYISVHDEKLGQTLLVELGGAGYEHEIVVTMIHAGGEIERAPHGVQDVSLATLRPALLGDWRASLPDADNDEIAQLADRTALAGRGAELTLLAVFDGKDITAHAELYIDAEEGIAQFENLVTHPDHRGRGYGGSLVRSALQRGQDRGCELSFLTAALDDWPAGWYRRVGYVEVGRTHHFSRSA